MKIFSFSIKDYKNIITAVIYNIFMPRPKTKEELLEVGQKEFKRLLLLIESLSETIILKSDACEQWSIKDILAHLHAWHNLYITWYREGMAGEKPQIPAPGYTWKTTPALNESIYQEYRDTSLHEVLEKLKESHNKLTEIINSHTDKELFIKKRYAWTGSTSLGSYTVSSTSSHYDWAIKLIKKFLKNLRVS